MTKVQRARQITDCGHENKSAMSRKTHIIENLAQGFIIIRTFKTSSGFGFFRKLPFSSKQYPSWWIFQCFKIYYQKWQEVICHTHVFLLLLTNNESIGHWTSPTIDHLKYARLGNLKIMMSKYMFQILGDIFVKISK